LLKIVLQRTMLLVPQHFATCGTAAAACEDLLRAVLLVLQPDAACGATAVRESFAARVAACASAGYRIRFSCCVRRVLLRAVLFVIQRVASFGAAVACEVFCCGRGCLFYSTLPRALPLL
jgi:hypothetical protein